MGEGCQFNSRFPNASRLSMSFLRGQRISLLNMLEKHLRQMIFFWLSNNDSRLHKYFEVLKNPFAQNHRNSLCLQTKLYADWSQENHTCILPMSDPRKHLWNYTVRLRYSETNKISSQISRLAQCLVSSSPERVSSERGGEGGSEQANQGV